MKAIPRKAEIMHLNSSKQPDSASSQVSLGHEDYVDTLHHLVFIVEVNE